MDFEPKNWTICTVFYSKKNWKNFFSFVTNDLIHGVYKGKLNGFFIFLGRKRGEHVTICLNLREKNNITNPALQNYLQKFLQNNCSENVSEDRFNDQIFCNYPNNSVLIHEGSFSSKTDCLHREMLNIRRFVSEIMLKEFCFDDVTPELVYTLLLYFQLGIVKAAFIDLSSAKEALLNLQKNMQKNASSVYEAEVGVRLEQGFFDAMSSNKEIILAIIDDFWGSEEDMREDDWIVTWIDNCNMVLNYLNFNDAFVFINKIIFEHLGLEQIILKKFLNCVVLKVFYDGNDE